MSPVSMDQIIHEGKIKLRGWAYSGGGHWPVRVEVSGDGGSVWYEVPQENMTTKVSCIATGYVLRVITCSSTTMRGACGKSSCQSMPKGGSSSVSEHGTTA